MESVRDRIVDGNGEAVLGAEGDLPDRVLRDDELRRRPDVPRLQRVPVGPNPGLSALTCAKPPNQGS